MLRICSVAVLVFLIIHGQLENVSGYETCSRSLNDTESNIFYTSEPVHDEYIVQFKGYYTVNARHGFLKASLQSIKQWEILVRHNPAFSYPSDFDLIRLYEKQDIGIKSLKRHPIVINVKPNLKVRRNLHSSKSKYMYGTVYNSRTSLTSTDTAPTSFWDTVKFKSRGLKRSVPRQITSVLNADAIWQLGFSGQGIKVAIFDTGLSEDHPHFKRGRIKDRTNWTEEKSKNDGLGHGTFVAGIIASSQDCLGFAPDSDLYIFRVFTNNQVSYTSWFLDAFNYAILKKIDVLNLSIGGPDFMDHPFVDKVSNC